MQTTINLLWGNVRVQFVSSSPLQNHSVLLDDGSRLKLECVASLGRPDGSFLQGELSSQPQIAVSNLRALVDGEGGFVLGQPGPVEGDFDEGAGTLMEAHPRTTVPTQTEMAERGRKICGCKQCVDLKKHPCSRALWAASIAQRLLLETEGTD